MQRRISDGSFRRSIHASAVDIIAPRLAKGLRQDVIPKVATGKQRLFYILGSLSIAIFALMSPLSIILYGEFTSLLVDRISHIGTISPTMLLPLLEVDEKCE